MINQNDTVDIILPVSGNYDFTKKCIDSIFKNTNFPFKLIIVDNGISENLLLDFLSSLKHNNDNVQLIPRDNARGFSASVNRGIEVSTSSLVAVLSNDIIVSENWLAKLKSGFSNNTNTGIIAPRCNNNIIPNIDVAFDKNLDIEQQLKVVNSYLENISQPDFTEVPFAPAYCLLIKRELIEKCGAFDTIYGSSLNFADFDLCFRAVEKGFKILINNKTVVYHSEPNESEIERLPYNFTIFKMKWQRSDLFKNFPVNMFKSKRDLYLQKDNEGFYFNENLSTEPKKYLLIHPSIVDTKHMWEYAYIGSDAPTGILRVGHYLINQGNKISFYDFEPYNLQLNPEKIDLNASEELFIYGKKMEDFTDYIKNIKNIDEVLITATMTYHYPHLSQIIDKIHEVYGDIKITIGGLYPTLCPEEVRKLGVEVHTGSYYTADNLRPLIEITTGKKSAVMRIVKGCPRTCSYCVVPGLEGRKVTQYQKENIIRHFQEFYSMGYTNYMFWDSNLLFGRENLYMLLDYMVDYGYNKTVSLDFSYGLEFALIDDSFIEKINKFHLTNSLYVPLESAEYDLYKIRFHRPKSHLGVMTKTVKKLQEARHNTMKFFVMLGLPNQTLDQVLKTTIFGWRLGLSPMMMLYTPIPGTEEFPKYLDLYKDKETWELNPFLYPCESEDLPRKILLFLHELSFFRLAYTEEEGFFLKNYVGERTFGVKPVSYKVIKLYFNDQNEIMKRLKELLYEEDVKSEEVDDRTLRFLHAVNM